MAEFTGERNAYRCDTCGGYVVTVNRDDGTTPFMLACRVKAEPPASGCDGTMRSLFYPKLPWPSADRFGVPIPLEPTHEWYRPDGAELKRIRERARRRDAHETAEHVRGGGLLLRRIER